MSDIANDYSLTTYIEHLERENAMMRDFFPCKGILDCVRCEHRVSPEECEVLEINAKHTIENARLRKVLADALSALRDWGAEEDGIPVDFGAWKAYRDGSMLLGWCIDPEYAAEGADDE